MFKEPAYWMYYFWSKNKRARKDKAVISNATWTMAILWFLNLMALHLLFEAPFIWIAGKLYYRPAKLKAMQAKYETMGEYRKLLGQCLFWLYVIGSFASFFIIAEQKNHSKEQPLIERLQEIRDGKYPVEKTHSPTGE